MIQLGIDTATDWLCLALHDAQSGQDLGSRELLAGRKHAKLLLPTLQELLLSVGHKLTDVRAICVGVGPGSYTGLRVGLASAQGLATGLGVPLSGGDSLAAAAWNQLAAGTAGWLVLDARRGNVYAGLYQRHDNDVTCLQAPAKLPLEPLKDQARSAGQQLLPVSTPSAHWLARSAGSGTPAEPLYL